MAKTKRERSFSPLLAFVGLVLLGLCVAAMVRRQDELAGGLAVLGLSAMVLAALAPRLTGTVKMGLTGFKMELVKLSTAGRLAGYSEEDILAAIEAKLKEQELASLAARRAADAARRHSQSYEDQLRQRYPPLAGPSLRDVESEYNKPIMRLRETLTSAPQDSPEYARALKQLAALLELKSLKFSVVELDSDEALAFLGRLEDVRRRRVS